MDLHNDDIIASDGLDWLQVARQQRLELSIVRLKHSQLDNRQTLSVDVVELLHTVCNLATRAASHMHIGLNPFVTLSFQPHHLTPLGLR